METFVGLDVYIMMNNGTTVIGTIKEVISEPRSILLENGKLIKSKLKNSA